MRILVTGAGGMLGRDVVSAARARAWAVTAFTHAELDVTDADAVGAAHADARPDAVVNCAAFTNVDGAETQPAVAAAVNATGAGNVARAAAAIGARVVHVSTDYVFDGTKGAPYVESDAPNPRSVYGASKHEGEREVAQAGGSHAIVRSSWLFGLDGRSFPATMLALGAEREQVAVVTDQIGFPTFTGHLADALLTLAAGASQGIHHVAGGGTPCSWHDFAVEIFRQAGIACRVVPSTTAEQGRPAPRPPFSALASERPEAPVLPPWQEGLATYLSQRKVHA